MKNNQTLIFIPTYNEKENVEKIYSKITELKLNIDILFLDDNSPDGTGILLDRLVKAYHDVNVIHRPKKLGIGSAHLAGIKWAYDYKYQKLITMDCDFTHSPEYLYDFIKYSDNYDVVIGSRYILKESLKGWNPVRKSLTLLGYILTKYLLKLPYDASGAYRLYRLDRIPQDIFNFIYSSGYSFFFESLYLLNINGFFIKEIPIVLPPRTYGHSKMSIIDIFYSVKYLFRTYLKNSINKDKFKIS